MEINKQILESPKNQVLQEDMEQLARDCAGLFAALRGKSVLVTGATGLLGSHAVKALACSNRLSDAKIRILAFVRSREKAQQVFGELLNRGDVQLIVGDILQPFSCSEQVDYIIHGASATSSPYFVSNPVQTIETALNGTKNALEFARTVQVEGFLYLSSLEVYGTPSVGIGHIDESYSGYLDPLQARSSYSEGKRMAECMCAAYASQYQVPVKIARLSQTFGAGVAYQDGRVFAEFARCIIEKRNIVLHTAGRTVRSYCYTKDAIAALFTILVKGSVGAAYNVANMDTRISIASMAQFVCGLFPEAGIQVDFDVPKDIASYGYNPEMTVALDSGRLMALGWTPTVGLAEMFQRLVAGMETE